MGMGRFGSADPAGMLSAQGEISQTWNRYAYVHGDPINYSDPSGNLEADPNDGGGNGPAGPCGPNWINDSSLVGPCPTGGSGSSTAGAGGGACSVLPIMGFVPVPSPTCYAPTAEDLNSTEEATPSCTISIASSATPRDGQSLVGLTNYSPLTNTLGAYSTIGRKGGGPQGWFFAVQIQANLLGDTNPSDWVASQTIATSGSFSVAGRADPITGTIRAHGDNPDYGINQGTTGRLDWLDEPGFPSFQFGGRVTAADLTNTFTSTVTNNKTGASCTVNWSLHFTLKKGVPAWQFH